MVANEKSSWLRRFGFRFTAVYLFVFNLPLLWIASYSETWLDRLYSKLWQIIVPWVACHIFGMGDAYSSRSFVWDDSDSWFAWIRWWCYLALAFSAALIWVWFDVRRRHDRVIREMIRVYIRYALVAGMLNYGVLKLLCLQFPYASLDWVALRWGELSPFMLMWGFMGHSPAYQAFAGSLEVLGAILLLFRRTTTLGALVVAGVMTNVVMLDLCFDVPVKLSSMNLLFFAVYMMIPDLRRLANVLVFNKPTQSVSLTPLWQPGWMNKTAWVTKVFAVGLLLYWNVLPVMQRAADSRAPRSEFYGLYTVESFTRDGKIVPPLMTDTNRWLKVKFSQEGDFATMGMAEQLLFSYSSSTITHQKVDGAHGTLTIQPQPKRSVSGETTMPKLIIVAYQRPAAGELLLAGNFDGAELSVTLRRINENELPLLKHKFRWVGR